MPRDFYTFQQPRVYMQWVDGTERDEGFDSEAARVKFVSDSVRNDPRIRTVRFYSRSAPMVRQ